MTKKVTAGRDNLGNLAPDFAGYNDDILFGEVWADETLPQKTRSIATVSAIMAMGAFEQLPAHMKKAKENGVSQKEMVALLTQLAFYTGWPKGWSAFNILKQVYGE
ncbi:carboxymuconolactone decarboxylase family protein [Fructobacillus sp. M1-13]|uniref:Carboxymuconolactone decarboxylase family protein n=1 Tax=Fructobacillus papyriferae TaxID=2713171 RepID=A0ABS5QNL5_9LACO|nr:carboxymuconolactone decarboxylase family protein [Fructobacillus papyriferae]MBS9334686.1 carboxymuconolactone decarboxylase family protein [Fructobacillus papyriferae]MCD2158676.1 carboxymuconolactone decarboxylase family protein [Fructobacillus papyriferae]